MSKRKFPLFIIDTNRLHKLGDCDFLVCTDQDNGFVAQVEYIRATAAEVGDDYFISKPTKGLAAKIQILRFNTPNPDKTKVRGLLKQASIKINDEIKVDVSVDASPQDCVKFIKKLNEANYHRLNTGDYIERKTVLTSMLMLDQAAKYIEKTYGDK